VVDDLDDGLIEYSVITTYDSEGRKVVVETDITNNGSVDAISTWTYVGDLLTLESTDDDNDGTLDTSTAYTYDGSDKVTLKEIDSDEDDDETVDTTRVYVYNGAGDVETITTDEGLDGDDSVQTYVYDGAGELLRIEDDDLADGIDVDGISDYSQTPDVGDIRVEYDTDNDGTVSEIIEVSYTADDQALYIWQDGNADEDDPVTDELEGPPDGTPEVVGHWTYHPNTTVATEFLVIWFPEGIPGTFVYEDPFFADYQTQYTYDADGRLSSTMGVFDLNQNGMIDLFDQVFVSEVTWVCP